MKEKKWISRVLIFLLLFSMNMTVHETAYAQVPYSGIVVSSGHSFPINIVIGPDGKLYVSEHLGNKIIKMDRNGENKTTFVTGLNQPVGMAFDSSGNLYVSELMGKSVKKVDTSGNVTYVKSFETYPSDIVIDSQGKILTVDFGNGKIYKMDSDGDNYSEFAIGFPSGSIIGMAIDSSDNIYVSDRSNSKIVKVTPGGTQSDFITGVTNPTWVTLGEDGFLYVSTGSGTIEKFDSNGTKVETFSTGVLSPWGSSVDACGYIYFTEYLNSIKKIVGSASTVDSTHISLLMNTSMGGVQTDPAAFTISGVASAPHVIAAEVSGQRLNLTLSNAITYFDPNIKVNYTKTGIDNLVTTVGTVQLDDFNGLVVTNNILQDQEAPTGLVGVAPSAALNDGKITGTTMAMEYKLATADDSSYLTCTDAATTVTTPAATYVVRLKAKIGYYAGAIAYVTVPADQAAPTGLVGVAPTAALNDGKITGTTTAMEYKLATADDSNYLSCTDAATTVTTPAATYVVRLKAKIGYNAGATESVTVPAYVAPNQDQAAPTGLAGVAPTSALNDGKITGTTIDMEYKLATADDSHYLTCSTGATTVTTTAATYVVRLKAKPGFNAGATASVTVPAYGAPNQDQAAPTGLMGVAPTSALNDGKITGTTTAMEYKLATADDSNYLTCSVGATTVTTPAATYVVRLKAKDGYNAGATASVTVPAYRVPSSDIGSSSSGSSSSTSSSDLPSSGADVIVNGQTQTAGTTSTSTQNGQTATTVTVDTLKLQKILDVQGDNATVTIPMPLNSDIAVVELSGQLVKNMEKKNATLEVKAGSATYTLPVSNINIDSISKQLGKNVTLSDIKVHVKIAKPSEEDVNFVNNAAKTGEFTIMVPPVEFSISCTYEGKTVDVNSFNSYIERMIVIPDGVDPTKITTGVVLNPDGTMRHVPTQVVNIGGKYYVKINSLTNSIYTAIWNPITFNDVVSHFAKDAINNMGSRLIVTGVGNGNYNPNSDITRAEFATIVVRALGLEAGTGNHKFSDVSTTDWFYGYVETASKYGIILGNDATTFAPNDKITREQAMIMIARAMKITGIEPVLDDSEWSALLANYTDAANVAEYAKASIASCLKAEIVLEANKDTLDIKKNITRAEVAVIIEKLLQKSYLI